MRTKFPFLFAALALVWLSSGLAVRAQSTAKLITLVGFRNADDRQELSMPVAGLIESGGLLYGTTFRGGPLEGGAVFQMTLDGTLTVLASFDAADNTGGPKTELLDAGDGNFYGTTAYGGPTRAGTIFRFVPGMGLEILHDFEGNDGDGSVIPVGALVKGGDGRLYGVTEYGGTNARGEVFAVTMAGVYSTLANFNDQGGLYPAAGLIVGPDGALYGEGNNPGTIFRITTDGEFRTVCALPGNTEGRLLLGSDGNLYGTTIRGGQNNRDTIFRATPAGAVTVLHTFSATDSKGINADGATPRGKLIEGTDGNFYGTASVGGTNRQGTIFQITPSGVFTTLHTFNGPDGTLPVGGVIEADNGTFYGTTQEGGPDHVVNNPRTGSGTVYQLIVSPAIRSAAAATATLGQAFAYQITHAFPATHYGVVGLPKGLGVDGDTGLISGTPEVSGVFTLTLNVFNAGGKGTRTLTLTIHGPPVVTSGSATVTEGTAFSYQIKATNNPTSYGVVGLPKGLRVDAKTGLISGKPANHGTFTLTLHANNAYGQGTGTLALTLRGTPVVTSATTARAQVGSAFSYQITATNAPTSYGVLGLPPGLKVDGKTGLISGTPTSGGNHTLTLHAANTAGTGEATLKLSIQAVPIITSAVSATGTVGKAFSFQITATDDPTNFGVLGLPKGLSIDGKTGLIGGTPTKAGTFTLTIKATNAVGTGSQNLTLTIKSS